MATVLRVRMVCDRLQVRAGVTTGLGRRRQKGFFFRDTSRKIVFIRARLFAHTFPKHPKSLTDPKRQSPSRLFRVPKAEKPNSGWDSVRIRSICARKAHLFDDKRLDRPYNRLKRRLPTIGARRRDLSAKILPENALRRRTARHFSTRASNRLHLSETPQWLPSCNLPSPSRWIGTSLPPSHPRPQPRARRARAPFRRPSDVGRCLFHLSVTTAKRRDERGGLRKRERAPRASLRR